MGIKKTAFFFFPRSTNVFTKLFAGIALFSCTPAPCPWCQTCCGWTAFGAGLTNSSPMHSGAASPLVPAFPQPSLHACSCHASLPIETYHSLLHPWEESSLTVKAELVAWPQVWARSLSYRNNLFSAVIYKQEIPGRLSHASTAGCDWMGRIEEYDIS